MPPPPLRPPTPLQQRRPTRPRPLQRRTISRSSASAFSALGAGLDTIIASGHATRTVRGSRGAATTAGPSAGAGDELFAASPLTQSPAPSPTPTPVRQAKATNPPGPTPMRSPTPSPRTPRFIAPQPHIAVGRFPSPPGPMNMTTRTQPSMPLLSPGAPMDVAAASTSPSYATITRTTPATATGHNTATATTARTTATTNTTAAASTSAATTAASAAPTASSTAAPKPANRYPPLIVEVLPDWPTHFRALKKLLGHAANGRPFGKGVRFIPKSDQEFRITQRYLTQLESETGISWFCYSLPAERSVKVAIRGLPVNTDPALVEQELRELGYTPEHVRAIPARPGRPGCLMFAQLQRTPNVIPGIYETRELICMPGIIIEAWRGRKGPAQCHRCQKFRHSSHNCHRPMACVRCGESHLARDCPRPREEPATCANCGGAHTANNAACPAYRKEARNRHAGTIAVTATRPATSTNEPNAPGSLMAAANRPQQQPGQKRRRKRGKRSSAMKPQPQPQPQPRQRQQQQQQQPTAQPKPTVVAASEKRTKAKRVALPQPTSQPARGPLDPRITTVVGTLNKVLMAIQEQRDPIPLILGCIAELCSVYG